jgi:hypothetical protein
MSSIKAERTKGQLQAVGLLAAMAFLMAVGSQKSFGQQELGCMTVNTAAWQNLHDAGSSWDRVFYQIHVTANQGGTNFWWTGNSFPSGNCYFYGSNSWTQLRTDTKYVVCFQFPPAWLTGQPQGKWTSPTNWTIFENFMVWVGTQINTNYCGAIEIMNEPYLNWTDTTTNLVRYLKVAARGLKKGLGTTNIPIIGPCNQVQGSFFKNYTVPYIAGYGAGDIGGLWTDTGGGNNLTGISEHDYPNGTASVWSQRPEGGMYTDLKYMISTFQSSGLGALPIYITEMGWFSYSSNTNYVPVGLYPDLAHFTAAQLILCAVSGIKVPMTFAGQYVQWGLIDTNGNKLPTYFAFKQAAKWLTSTSNGNLVIAPFSGGNQYVATFSRPNGNRLIALWCDTNSSTYRIQGTVIAAEDWQGKAITVGSATTSSNLVQYIETTAPPPALSPVAFVADFNGAGSGTGGNNDMVTSGGTAVLGSFSSVASTNPFNAGSGGHLLSSIPVSTTGQVTMATFSPASVSNTFSIFQGTNIPNGANPNSLNLNGAVDLFVQPVLTEGGSYYWFRPIDIDNRNASTGTGLRMIWTGQRSGTNHFLQFELVAQVNALASNPGFTSPFLNKQVNSGNFVFTPGQIYHLGVTISTDIGTGLITMNEYAVTGTGPIDTSFNSPDLIGTASFYANANLIGTAFSSSAAWPIYARSDAGNFTANDIVNYDTVRLYNGVPDTFYGLPLPPLGFLPPLLSGGNIVLSWTNCATLLWASNIAGPWITNALATNSPYSETVVPTQNRFYQLQQR